jgi:hypothetical protein
MKRLVINIILVCAFISSVVLISAEAVGVNPMDARYWAARGDSLSQAGTPGGKVEDLIEAKKMYANAIKLNPAGAEYFVKMGQAELSLFLADNDRFQDEFMSGWNAFDAAYKNDPHGFNTTYAIGYAGMNLWGILDDRRKEFVLENLAAALKARPYYADYIYEVLWKHSQDFSLLRRVTPATSASYTFLYNFLVRNNIMRYRKDISDIIDIYKESEDVKIPQRENRTRLHDIELVKKPYRGKTVPSAGTIPRTEWKGKAKYVSDVIVDGAMYWNGTVRMIIDMKPGKADISVEMKKFLVIKTDYPQDPKFFPYAIIRFDDEELGGTFVANDDWQRYSFPVKTDGGLKVLSVEFINDVYDEKRSDDRNLAVGDVTITYR